MVIKKGFTAKQLQSCLEEYSALDVLMVSAADGLITFNHDMK